MADADPITLPEKLMWDEYVKWELQWAREHRDQILAMFDRQIAELRRRPLVERQTPPPDFFYLAPERPAWVRRAVQRWREKSGAGWRPEIVDPWDQYRPRAAKVYDDFNGTVWSATDLQAGMQYVAGLDYGPYDSGHIVIRSVGVPETR